jgi:transposase-like protein
LQPGNVLALIEDETHAVVAAALNLALEREQSEALGRPRYGRNSQGLYRNGFREAFVPGILGGFLKLRRPALRRSLGPSKILDALRRAGGALVATLAVKSWLHGSSTRAVARDLNTSFGTRLTHADVSAFSEHLVPAMGEWAKRPVAKDLIYLLLDATYLPMVRGRETSKQALLVALGVDSKGYRHVLGYILGDRESQDSWTALLDELLARGLDRSRLRLVISDDHKGIDAAVSERLALPHQVCVIHAMRNARHRVSNADRKAFLEDFKAAFWAASREEALVALGRFEQRWAKTYPALVRQVLEKAPRYMVFFQEPRASWVILRSTNLIERFIKEIKRRFRAAGTMQSENEVLKLFCSVAMQHEENWARHRVHGARSAGTSSAAMAKAA